MLVSASLVSCGGHSSVHTEAVKTRIFHMTPVTEDTQLHESIHHVTGLLHETENKSCQIALQAHKSNKRSSSPRVIILTQNIVTLSSIHIYLFLLTGSLKVCVDSPFSSYVNVPSSVPSSVSSFIPWERKITPLSEQQY